MANEEYPEFLMLHSFIFERNDKNDGREIMEKYLLHIKSNLIRSKSVSVKLKADEISSIIKERIENFDLSVNIEETGKVISVADGVANV